jgi:serine/threonine protein phosphatase PrpC
MHIESSAVTDVGLKRDHNEDSCLADDAHGLYVVADGMGGAAAGEVASAMAIDRVTSFFRPRVAELRQGDLQNPAFRQRLVRLMDAAIQDACQHVYRAAVDDQNGKAGMGTTLTMLVLLDRLAIVGHVGDSRMYLKRNDTLYPLTVDHSFVNEMVQRGALSEEEALKHPMANLLTRAVGPQANVVADVNVIDVYSGDVFVLCSDGVSKGVSESTVLQALSLSDATLEGAAHVVIDAANAAGGDDNATVVLARVSARNADVSGPHEAVVEDKARALRELPLFAGLGHAHLQAVVNLAGTLDLKAGDIVVEAGKVSRRFFVLVRGRMMLSLHGAEVLEVPAGTHFGEVECFDGKPSMLEATAMTPSLVLTFERAHIEDLCRRDPALGVQLLWRFTTALSSRVDEVLRRGTLTELDHSVVK